MAKLDKAQLTDWQNGQVVTEAGLEADFEILRIQHNLLDDEIKTNKTSQDGIAARMTTAEADIDALEGRATELEKPIVSSRIVDKAITYEKLGMDLQASIGYEYEWVAAEGQTLFELPSDMTYPVGTKSTELVIGGLEQSSGAYTEASPSSIETTSAVPTGVKVKLKWRKGLMPTTSVGHQGTHQKGGADAIRIDTLDQYEELVAGKIGILSKREVNVLEFCVGDGVTDDSQNLRNAYDKAKLLKRVLFVPVEATLKVTSTTDLRFVDLDFQGTIMSYVDNQPCLIVGDTSQSVSPRRIFIASVKKGNTLNVGDIGIRVQGTKNSKVEVLECFRMQLYADASQSDSTSIAYSHFYLGKVDTLDFYGETGTSWINENKFFGGRFKQITIGHSEGTYNHNNNIFYSPCLEGAGSILDIVKGVRNRFYDIRTEGGTAINFSSGTYYNYVEDNYVATYSSSSGGATVIDTDGMNTYRSSIQDTLEFLPLVTIDKDTKLFNNNVSDSTITSVEAGLKLLKGTSFGNIFEVIIPVDKIKRFLCRSDKANIRTYITCYDANMNLLDGDSYMTLINGGVYDTTNKYYKFNSNTNLFNAVFNNPIVKFAKIRLAFGGSPTPFEYIKFYAEVDKTHMIEAQQLLRSFRQPLFATAAITKGIAKVGEIVQHATGQYKCTLKKETTLSTTAASGATAISLTDASTMANGDVVGILLDDNSTHWTTISSISTNDVTIATALPSQASSGKTFVANRWV